MRKLGIECLPRSSKMFRRDFKKPRTPRLKKIDICAIIFLYDYCFFLAFSIVDRLR